MRELETREFSEGAVTVIRESIDRLRAENAELRADLAYTQGELYKARVGNDALRAEINALNMSHSITVGELEAKLEKGLEMIRTLSQSLWDRDVEIGHLRAKLATMVCGTCKGAGRIFNASMVPMNMRAPAQFEPCPVCQPKEGT